MTVIAWHGETKTLAGDKRMSCNGYAVTVTKIAKRADGWLVGCCGGSDSATELMDWFIKGGNENTFPPLSREDTGDRLLVVSPDAKIYMYIRSPIPIEINDSFFAIGGGCDFAITAMYLGKNAVEAVQITCELDTGCGNGIDSLTL
jgi:hypothetical protein